MSFYYLNTNTQSFATNEEALAWACDLAAAQSTSSNNQLQELSLSAQEADRQAPVQILIEPADQIQPTSQENPGPKRKSACERCRKQKVKCEDRGDIKGCDRCSRMGHTCVPTGERKKKRRAQPPQDNNTQAIMGDQAASSKCGGIPGTSEMVSEDPPSTFSSTP